MKTRGTVASTTYNRAGDRLNTQIISGVSAVSFDANLGEYQIVNCNNAASNPTVGAFINMTAGRVYTVVISNTTAGALAGQTWTNAQYKFAGAAAPAVPGAGLQNIVTFEYDGTNMRELARSVGVPN